MEPIVGRQAYAALRKARDPKVLADLLRGMERAGMIAITREDGEYPARLRAVPDAPPVLFLRGRASLEGARMIAIVGARNSTAYGTRIARRIARELSASGVTVVSGLARGIDSAAHRGAVDAHARTIAVLGSGVDVIYPPEHMMLADEILENGGSILSEQPPGALPLRHHFPARNRIISGLSSAVLLVEGARKSGALSTVAHATEQGRDVYAIPGQADSPLSEMTHALIREGARLVTSAAELLSDLGWDSDAPATGALPAAALLTQAEQRVVNLLAGGPVDTDALVTETGMSVQELGALLTVLELNGVIRKLPGRRVERVGGE